MIEQAFKLVKNCPLYNDVFESKKEKQKFHDLARVFFSKHNLDNISYIQSKYLCLELNNEQQALYSTQLKKGKNQGLFTFKANSKMQKDWEESVIQFIDFNIIYKYDFWYHKYISKGSYSLWDYGDEVYGYLKDSSKDKIELSEDMIPIKMSEYYKIIEESENK